MGPSPSAASQRSDLKVERWLSCCWLVRSPFLQGAKKKHLLTLQRCHNIAVVLEAGHVCLPTVLSSLPATESSVGFKKKNYILVNMLGKNSNGVSGMPIQMALYSRTALPKPSVAKLPFPKSVTDSYRCRWGRRELLEKLNLKTCNMGASSFPF